MSSTRAEGTFINTVVLYHKGCVDGLVAAWSAYKNLGEGALYIPHQYGDPLPDDIQGKQLILVDLSLPIETLKELQKTQRVSSVLIIDHHKSALPLLELMAPVKTNAEYIWKSLQQWGETPLFICFDQEHSGAVLSWMFFNEKDTFVEEEVPKPIRLVEDYDLWRFNHPDTRPVNAWLRNNNRFEDVDLLVNCLPGTYDDILEVGHALLTYDKNIVNGIVKGYVESGQWGSYRFALVNGPHHLRNEISDVLLKQGDHDLVVVCNRRRDVTVYSLRSRKGGPDVADIAEQFGGGGHVNASSYVIPHSAPQQANQYWLERLDPKTA